MPTRPSVPAPKPLSPRAAAYVASVKKAADQRYQDISEAVAVALTATPTGPVRKATAKTDQVAIYDADGNLVGTVDPSEITMLAAPKAPDAPDAPPADLTPAPPASVGTPADAVPAATAKAMSSGAEQRGAHQLGGPTPRGGVPTVPAEDTEEAIAKARALSCELKKSLNGGMAVSAAEQVAISSAMSAAAYARFQELRQAGLMPGAGRRR